MPRDNGELGAGLPAQQGAADQTEDLIGYSLIAATIMVGVVFAIVFAAF
jgi:hypothetical protein